MMNAQIFYVGGSKGGVGKSKMSFALIDYLLGKGNKVFLVESDNSNPDVYKAHEPHKNENLVCGIMDLDNSDGWLELVDSAEDYPEHIMVINSAARSNTGIAMYGTTLKDTLPQLNRELTTFWMINRQRDSVELLRDFINSFFGAKVNVCRNLYFGKADKFDVYNTARIKEVIEETGHTLDFPALSPRVADRLYSDRMPIWVAEKNFRISERVELSRWKNLCARLFEAALEGK